MLTIVVRAKVKSVDQKVDSLTDLMSLDEKIGQTNQYNDDWTATGSVTLDNNSADPIRNGQVDVLLNT